MLGLDGREYFVRSIDFITSQIDVVITNLKLDPSQVGMGFLAYPFAESNQWTPYNVISAAYSCLTTGEICGQYKPKRKYPTIRGIMSWAIQWDWQQDFLFTNSSATILLK